jgi:hypothetical protein
MIKLRSLTEDDLLKIDAFAGTQGLPDLRTRVIDAVAENEKSEIVGYGQVKLFAEAQIFLDHSKSRLDKTRAVRELMREAFRGVEHFKLHEVYAFILDPEFADFIVKHFSFERQGDRGEILIRRL